MRVGVIGVGNMGSKYAQLIQDEKIEGLELAALTRVRPQYQKLLEKSIERNIPVYQSAEELFEAIENKTLQLDAVIIATPHYAHEEQAVRAYRNGLHVLSDKPAGVYTRQASHMSQAAKAADKAYGMVFNQRTNPLYIRMKEIVESGVYGELKRVNWIVTDWYRPEGYFKESSWHATWKKDGGGVLLNQCPHNLDLLQWICGMPKRVQGFCHAGRFHDIEVEDDVTVYMEWENGANGTFITSTGDAPGINRLEISLDEAMLICENGELRIGELYPELGMKEAEYRKSASEYFRKIKGTFRTERPQPETDPYQKILSNFSEVIGKWKTENPAELIADGSEGKNSLLLSNAIYLSSWERRMVDIPAENTKEEEEFQNQFEAHLKNLCQD